MCFPCICLFVFSSVSFCLFSLSRGLAAVCDCDTPWTFLVTFFLLYLHGMFCTLSMCMRRCYILSAI